MVTDAKDPGNSSPDEWTEPLDEEAQQKARDLLEQQRLEVALANATPKETAEEESDGSSSASNPE